MEMGRRLSATTSLEIDVHLIKTTEIYVDDNFTPEQTLSTNFFGNFELQPKLFYTL